MASRSITFSQNLRLGGSTETLLFKADEQKLGWKRANGTVTSFLGSELKGAEWVHVAPDKCMLTLTVETLDGLRAHRVVGFMPRDQGKVQEHFQQAFKVRLDTASCAVQGRTWCRPDVQRGALRLRAPEAEADGVLLDVDLHRISAVNAPPDSSNEVTLELSAEKAHAEDDVVTDMVFCVPQNPECIDAFGEFKAELVDNTTVDTAEVIVTSFPDISIVVPRGKYELRVLSTCLKFHGKSADHTVQFKQISKCFVLGHPDGKQTAFALSLHPPLRQGNSTYSLLVLDLKDRSQEICVAVDPGKAPELGLELEEKGPLIDVLTTVFHSVSGKTMVTECKDFASKNKAHCVRCVHKQNEGQLYPLKNSFIFVKQGAVNLRYEHVEMVVFARTESVRSFDITVKLTVAAGGDEFEFLQIDKADLEPLTSFLEDRKPPVEIAYADDGCRAERAAKRQKAK